ncbi:unnamed protein product [Allacma fusca]|uniref:Cytochrome b5 heme-binding domain-containing protein n=1 Tax=Allacma fusca TaxID=39272 RepID=A0A8J2LJG4_9HEXA|nr:unnamed protein product [Allacma fusca]
MKRKMVRTKKSEDSDLLTEDSGWTSNEEKPAKKPSPKRHTKVMKKSPSRKNESNLKTLDDDTRYPRSVYLFLLFLMSSSIPVMIIMHQICSTGDSFVCTTFRTMLRSVAPGVECVGKRQGSHSPTLKPASGSHSTSEPPEEVEARLSTLSWMKKTIPNARVFSSEEIKYQEGKPFLLVIVGHVFDVTTGSEYYKPGSGYFGFIGQDGSRAFVTGEFNEKGLVDNINDLSNSDYLGLANWIKFYFEKYKFVGYHAGRFFDQEGKQTDYFKKFHNSVVQAELAADVANDILKIFPPCNISWSQNAGSRVWCTKQSGGIKRDWTGYPRQFFETNKEPRCACVHENMLNDPRIRPYPNCDLKSDSCVPPE